MSHPAIILRALERRSLLRRSQPVVVGQISIVIVVQPGLFKYPPSQSTEETSVESDRSHTSSVPLL